MASGEAVLLIQPGVEGGVLSRDEIFRRLIAGIPQGSAYDLLYFSVVDIDTGTNFIA